MADTPIGNECIHWAWELGVFCVISSEVVKKYALLGTTSTRWVIAQTAQFSSCLINGCQMSIAYIPWEADSGSHTEEILLSLWNQKADYRLDKPTLGKYSEWEESISPFYPIKALFNNIVSIRQTFHTQNFIEVTQKATCFGCNRRSSSDFTFQKLIFLKSEDWLWFSHTDEICSFLYYCNTVLCMEGLSHCCMLH